MSFDSGAHALGIAAEPSRNSRPAVTAPLTIVCRAGVLLGALGLSMGLCVGLLLLKDPLFDYVSHNDMRPRIRLFVLGTGLAGLLVTAVSGLTIAWVHRRDAPFDRTLSRVAHRLAPLGVVGFLPLLFQWRAWKDRDLAFLFLVALSAFVLEAGLRSAISVGPFSWEALVRARARAIGRRISSRLPRLGEHTPVWVVGAASVAYAAYFIYYTLAWHRGVHTGFDLGVENNLLWNLVHHGTVFRSTPLKGPAGATFGHDAPLFAFALAPFYAVFQRPEFLLVVQSLLLAVASVPLFLWARLRLSPAVSCALAIAYLFYPCVHCENLYEFHYLTLVPAFLWMTLYAAESNRGVVAVLSAILALSVHQDAAILLAVVGVYLLSTGRAPRASAIVVLLATVYFVSLKAFLLPRFGEAAANVAGRSSSTEGPTLALVLQTFIANPWYSIGTLLEEDKLKYLLQVLVPLAFIPARRPLFLLFALPGLILTLLSNDRVSLLSIHFHYTAYWTAMLFPALVLALCRLNAIERPAALGALLLALTTTSFQYGAVLQHNTSWSGPTPFHFGMDKEDERRRTALNELLTQLPRDAKAVGCAFVTPQISSRSEAYNLTLGVYDADYLLCPSERTDFVADERQTLLGLLSSGSFGVVSTVSPFVLARRGAPSTRNDELSNRLR